MSIKLIIADDHPVVRDGIRSILTANPCIALVGEASGGKQLLQLCAELQPDVVLTDVVMRGEMDGENAAKVIEEKHPLTKVVAMSMYERYHDIMRMTGAGAIGYISKNAEQDEYLEAIEHAARSQAFFCKRIRLKLQTASAEMRRIYDTISFSERELQVLRLLLKGSSNAEISHRLQVSVRTVEGYRLKMLEKFDTSNILKVIMYALTVGYIKIDEYE